ncbi:MULTISPECIES: molybdopterin synthase sulfur carrier subunit [Photobacterium]|uniref:Molybdopterin synthase sulfur carrier subunit n=1 Tax=Photobacterium piscicola TaxID=1378299 RepID=A0A1T5I1M4_9GAMM|nr:MULTISPECIES: molybdopterin synthase sulfur carrier subunit [Photobacterium]MEC6822610.1 molybdopterin synthase sulfur carrier subunit [Photobacterium piscicola]MEC6882446.1 molybdopterin synthase sulfur carrier subunit [Photobacterium piscicola]MEC6897987.1 molybdopterin synthase sulfur carrier subunit [Photobacterium piscicola]MEC6908399.1 molybdopterin synthase sulfur carrier subunit [Photobacterium piscicola]PST88614.1 molybdopterin synthase sulfur carrier subunit [Photobacterium sp. NC
MINVLFFAQIKELVGVDKIEVAAEFATADDLRQALLSRGDKWQLALESGKLLVAVNQTICHLDTAIKDGDEVAFFPPVTGG